jgi:hypothetical protein
MPFFDVGWLLGFVKFNLVRARSFSLTFFSLSFVAR